MKRNMKQWITDTINNPVKKAMPVLSSKRRPAANSALHIHHMHRH